MKIYYFTGTGNTLYVAQEVSKDIQDVELISIKSCQGQKLAPQGSVGIAFPLYAFGLPKLVKTFLQETDFSQVDYFFGLQTRSGSPGRAFSDMQKFASKKLDASFVVNMPSAYLVFGDLESKEKNEQILSKASKKIATIKRQVEEKAKKRVHEFCLVKIMVLPIYYFWKRFSDLGKKYFADSKCTGCGICSKVCPVGCISMKNAEPVWSLEKCQSCMACINYCPTRAIQLNKKTKGYSRYHHPAIDWKQIVR